MIVDNATFDSPAQTAGFDFDQEIQLVQVPVERLPKELIWLPALLLLGGVVLMQRARAGRPASPRAA
jgi:hypothetical protein